jgi:hypothetical protein
MIEYVRVDTDNALKNQQVVQESITSMCLVTTSTRAAASRARVATRAGGRKLSYSLK